MFHRITPRVKGVTGLWRGPTGTVEICPPALTRYPPLAADTAVQRIIVNPYLQNALGNNYGQWITGGYDSWTAFFQGSATTGFSFGPLIAAGTNASDIAIQITNQAQTTDFLNITGTGAGFIGWSTGSSKQVIGFGSSPVANCVYTLAGNTATEGSFQLQLANALFFIGSTDSATGTGSLWLQAGGGSSGYGGGIIMYGAANASFAGAVLIGVPTTSGVIELGTGLTNGSALTTNWLRVSSSSIQGLGPTAAALVDMTPDKGTFTGSLTGYASALSPSCSWRKMGNIVALQITTTTGTSNATSMTMTGLPAEIQSSLSFSLPCYIEDSGVISIGNVLFTASSGTLTFGKTGITTGGFTASGTKGIPGNILLVYAL